MYPNPQDVLPLPPRPDVAQYRRRARELASTIGDDAGLEAWAERWVRDLARLNGNDAAPRAIARAAGQVATFARERRRAGDGALSEAQFVIARAHGFASWPAFIRHLEALAVAASGTAAFERAADAIVAGDLDTVDALLRAIPELVRARSAREHRATLLHYTSANGVENYRQRTPPNIVDIARRLLDAGADVHAHADVYGGGADTLGLVVTSAHPRAAGVQNALADLLLERGATMRGDILRDCLANGCPEAAAHLARRGAPVDLESACGIGDADRVRELLDAGAAPTSPEAVAGLNMAAWYDARAVIALLLDRGLDVGTRIEPGREGHTALHLAAYCGHAELAALLLDRGAPVDVADERYGTTPAVWALHGWLVEGREPEDRFVAILTRLAAAGARVRPDLLDDERLRRRPALVAALASGT